MASFQTVPSTPPPPSRLHSPPTPKHGGFHDDWEPFTPRKSARISAKRASINRTPSPSSTPQQTSLKLHHRSPPTAKKSSSSAMASPTSPVKKRAVSAAVTRNASATLTADDSINAAARLGLMPPVVSGMLPTPSKTPIVRQGKKDETDLKTISRNIFKAEDDEMVPSPKKRRAKKYNGLSLESFRAEEVEEEIPIYTDSQERIPEVDNSANNPFNSTNVRVGATTRSRSKRTIMVNIPGEGPQPLDDALARKDGLVYVFRGKKKFRKFKDLDDSSEGATHSAGEASPLRGPRPLTGSSIKPRLLFPSKTTADIDEEEATTDIEEAGDAKAAGVELVTPADQVDNEPFTPKAPKFAPASPPTTGRAVRAANKPVSTTSKGTAAKVSPFDGWRRKKGPAAAQGQKRHAESLENDHAKRVRSSV